MPEQLSIFEARAADTSQTLLPQLPLPGNIPGNHLAIADMADAFGVTHRTLHFYEEKGLLSASRMGPMRVYNLEDMRRMAIINACRETDMPIADIQDLMGALTAAASQEDAVNIFAAALHARRRELAAQQSILRRQMQRVSELLESTAIEASGDAKEKTVHLSPIELKCVGLMAEGHSATRIASSMDMDLTAVLTLESNIIRKFNAHNRFQAITKAVALGYVSSE